VVVGDHDDVGTGPALDGGGDPRLDVVLVDPLQADLDAGLLAELPGLGLEEDVGGRDEVRPLQELEAGGLGERGRPSGRHDAFHPERRDSGRGAGCLEELPTTGRGRSSLTSRSRV
jgi:hypothetical protein